ncbi:hypothetical protein V6Z11_A13G011100 [Gossypium hirsutum]
MFAMRIEIQHVIHRHLLSLSFIEERSSIAWCKGCVRKLSGPTYRCEPCRYFIHKSCLNELKAEVQSFFHPCPLTISSSYFGRCFVCFKLITSDFSYKCKLNCWFVMHKDEVICSICQELCSSSFSTYGCLECEFFLHKFCMKSILQQLINHRIHPCTLIFITYPYGYDECDCCGEHIVSGMKFYCNICDLNLHVKCALFPTIDSEDAKEIKHFYHPHTLAHKHTVICSFCEELCSSSSSIYGCMECKFFLHKSCMKNIPRQLINHDIHPCTLIIITNPYGNDKCDCCGKRIDFRMFSKYECKFNLHLDCYKVLPSITFSGHEHLLALLEKTPNVTCRLCSVNCRNFILRCVPCDINIHLQCLPSAPKTIKHKSHLHPLTITKSPFEYELNSDEEDDEFYCEVCEQKRNKRELIYYCAECKFIAEVKCVISEDNLFEKEIPKNHLIEVYPKIQKWQLENLLLKHIKLHEEQLVLEAKMKQLEATMRLFEEDWYCVENEMWKTKGMLGNLARGSSELLIKLIRNQTSSTALNSLTIFNS